MDHIQEYYDRWYDPDFFSGGHNGLSAIPKIWTGGTYEAVIRHMHITGCGIAGIYRA